MVVIILEKVPAALRGELTRWMIEPRAGVFVGHMSARVRDKLWEKCAERVYEGGVMQIWSTNTEQHFAFRMFGDTSRIMIIEEGLYLIKVPGVNPRVKRLKKIQSTEGEKD